MERHVIRLAAVLTALLAGLGLAASPAWAAGSDLAVQSADGREGDVGQIVSVPIGLANRGPDPIGAKPVTVSYRAPAGSVIVRANGATNCVFNVARTTARCQLGADWRAALTLKPGEFVNRDLDLRVDRKITAPGAVSVSCGCDSKKSNNATNIVLNGVTKPMPSTSPKPSSKPSASASPSPEPSATPSETPEATEEPSAEESTEPAVAEPSEPPASGSATLSGLMLVGFGIVLLGLVGLGGAVYLWRMRAGRDDDDGDGDGYDMDATQVIR
ncbi:hypothetical protein [Catellatospora chokoriensis]|uniref:Uncharacterized protein n=1 Tax=Catellatospora chokoriensis TaxID=310353 RepID=A0A8J3K8P9_9ACTN|nr:hypothetical protein [Catellatospora chokoriensis]GIF90564.1 hypothetical protein Cch02nite_40080 [Catellatospora chokoriensis]